MKTTNIRILSLILAAIFCLSTLLTACGGESQNTSEEDPRDIEEVLTDAYKQTKKAKSLKMDIEQKNESDDGSTEKTVVSGQFAKNADKDLVGFVTETVNGKVTEKYYHFDTYYINSEYGRTYSEAERPFTIETACLEEWVLPLMNVRDFKTFAKELGKSDAEMTNEDGEISITLECKATKLIKILLGKELYDTWYENLKGDEYLYNQFKNATSNLSIDIDEEGRLSRIDIDVTTPNETSKITVKLSQFEKNFDIVRPEWANYESSVGEGSSVNPPDQAYETPFLNLSQTKFTITPGEVFYICDYVESSYYDQISFQCHNLDVISLDSDGRVEGLSKGSAAIDITVTNGPLSQHYFVYVTVDFEIGDVTFFDEKATIGIGKTYNLYNSLSTLNPELFFDSADPFIATVGGESGIIKGVAEGNTVIYVYAAHNDVHYPIGEFHVSVKKTEVDVDDIYFFDTEARIDIGKDYNLYDSLFTLNSELYFESSNPSVATVGGEDGVIRGISQGEALIYVYAVYGDVHYPIGEFPVIVDKPWQPTDPISKEVVSILESNAKKIHDFGWYNVSVITCPQYNVDGLLSATAGPVEIWANTLQLMFRFQKHELDATVGIESPETYNYYFDFYYRPYSESSNRGKYQKATLQPWSIYNDSYALYRCKFYDAFFVENDGLIEDQLYELVVVIRQNDTVLAYAESELYWSDSCACYVRAAEQDPTIIK